MENNLPTNQTRLLSRFIIILGIILGVLIVFQAGMFVGYRKAVFSYNWNNNYLDNANDPHSLLAPFMRDGDDLNPHGAAGQIVSVRLPVIMVKGNGSAEEIVTISPTTTIRYGHNNASSTDIASGQRVIVIGTPDGRGQIQASFMRIMPMMRYGSTTWQY